ncbi:uncharacterized protein [Rutidosis leptorrhynchoides]|uniref:uncharacterized protein n=1 Tax=Rutidosis leptorrhynchoides TaxID=125765 RepID=UPI003A9A0BA1
MSGRRRKSESLWDRKEDEVLQNETKDFDSSFHGDGSPKWLNVEANDELMSDDFFIEPSRESMHVNENMSMDNDRRRMKMDPAFDGWDSQYSSRAEDNVQPYRDVDRGVGSLENSSRARDRSRSRSLSPHRNKGRDRDRDRDLNRGSTRVRDQGMARNPSRGGENRIDHESGDYHRSDRSGYDYLDHRRKSTQSKKPPCRFFMMGKCNRSSCKFSHDLPISEGDGRLHDNIRDRNSGFSDFPNPKPDSDDKNKSWNDPFWNNLESGGFNKTSRDLDLDLGSNQESQPIRDSSQLYNSDGQNIVSVETNPNHYSYGERFNQDVVHHNSSQLPSNVNTNGSDSQLNGSANEMLFHMDFQNQSEIQNKESLELLESFKNNKPQVNETIAEADPVHQISSNLNLTKSQSSMEPVEHLEVNENKIVDKSKAEEQNMNPGKCEAQEKVEEGKMGNDEKAMRQFKVALVEFVKEILKPTWKEGKMSREVYKTIVKKVVDKVTSTIQGVQIPRTQEKIDQYLAFSKSKITKLVEAYVGRHQKA